MQILKLNSTNQNRPLFICVLLIVLFIFQACKKSDSLIDNTKSNSKEITQEKTPENFLKLPANAAPVLHRIANELERQNKVKEFIKAFIAKEGFPIWHKERIVTHKRKNQNNLAGFDGEGLEDTTVYIPLVVNAQQYVHGFLKATITDTIDIQIFRQNDYVNFPFQTPSSSTSITTAENFALRMMLMDNDVFGSREFKVEDKRLFHNSPNYNDTAGIQVFVKIDSTNGAGNFANGSTVSNTVPPLYYEVLVYTPCSAFSGSVNNTVSVPCWNVSTVIYWAPWGQETENPSWPVYPPGGGGGGVGGGGNPPGGGGSPCGSLGASMVNGFVPIECAPGPGGNPWPTRDANGFLYTRIAELKYKLSLNPFAVEPCDSLNIMPLDPFNGYGTMFQRVAQSTPTQYVKNRIDSIKNVAFEWVVDNFYTTNFDNAYGSIVNCDFFPVRITQMPNGFTPESLTEYFRKNINQFIDTNLHISFHPYNDGANFYDTAKFNAFDINSLGALIHINMINEGSVIESNYYHNYTQGFEKHRFTFSTMATPLDLSHPVAGNREFGVYRTTDVNHPNDFVFYTMGVDRINDWVFASGDWINQNVFGNPSGFENADELWSNIQKNMISFINNPANGGHAEYYGPASIKARPKYNDVKDFLLGTISWEQLMVKLGC